MICRFFYSKKVIVYKIFSTLLKQPPVLVFSSVILWSATGPLFHFSEDWQLVMNTSRTIITFLKAFLIQHFQNKDTTAMQIKLNELLAANKNVINRVVTLSCLIMCFISSVMGKERVKGAYVYKQLNIEDLSEPGLMLFKVFYKNFLI